uniref:Putative secreted protein n=1 Tax=Anopheles triannulatus TaxID=58253 RepID=A0A2M4B1X0_9DIPT
MCKLLCALLIIGSVWDCSHSHVYLSNWNPYYSGLHNIHSSEKLSQFVRTSDDLLGFLKITFQPMLDLNHIWILLL